MVKNTIINLLLLALLLAIIHTAPKEDKVDFKISGYTHDWYSGNSIFIQDISTSLPDITTTYSSIHNATPTTILSSYGSTEDLDAPHSLVPIQSQRHGFIKWTLWIRQRQDLQHPQQPLLEP